MTKSELSEVLRKLGVLSLKVLDVGIVEFEVGRFSWNFSSDTYPEDERIQGRHGGYDPSTYQLLQVVPTYVQSSAVQVTVVTPHGILAGF
ncbi:hypothetical protein ACFX11_003094 [Malus domestica]